MMRIIGRGLIAQSLEPYAALHDGTVAFATGVAASTSEDGDGYRRELDQLRAVLADAAASGERVVYFSGGGAVYGDWSHPVREDDPPRPQTTYGRHQLACERLLAASAVPHLILRLPNVIGPSRNREQLLPSIVAQVLSGTVIVQSEAERDLIGASDFARVTSAVLPRVDANATINLASGASVAVDAIVNSVMRELGVRARIEHVAGGTRQRFSIDRLKDILGGDPFPRPYPLDAVLSDCVPKLARMLEDVPA
ncbi:MAG TPA: NAD-dependent epimerase/dehydratase family protein [Candidatus Limnocylindrales bacterium]